MVNQIFGEREIVIARELTKIHEEFIRGRGKELILQLKKRVIKGELVILIKGESKK
jgi:16S rRNA (cytidine1402-2'-O)-methyltransferase